MADSDVISCKVETKVKKVNQKLSWFFAKVGSVGGLKSVSHQVF